MKKKVLLILTLCIVFCIALAIGVSAEKCAECKYEYTVEFGPKGFLDTVSSEGKCGVCGSKVTSTYEPIFVALGYSYNEDGVCQGFAVNRESLALYEAQTGKTINFGAVITSKNAIGDGAPLDENGNPISSKVKVADFTDSVYDIMDVTIRGIPYEARNAAQLVFAFYINVEGRITYIDNFAEMSNTQAVTYSDVAGDLKKGTSDIKPVVYINGKAYLELELDYTQAKYWYQEKLTDTSNNPTFNNKFWGTTNSFTKETLPVGSLIVLNKLEEGWQYRPYKWTGTRPDNTKAEVVEVTEEWWGSFKNVGFNISKTTNPASGATGTDTALADISGYEESYIKDIIEIYVPYTKEGAIFVPEQGETPEQPTPEEPNVDYSAQKQDWDEDGALKILAIGNSFSVDSMRYIYQAAQNLGIKEIVLGNLYIGGCSLATHLDNAANDKQAYTYYLNTNGTWDDGTSMKISDAVVSQDWDFITFQQASGYSGLANTYDDLDALIDIVEPLNPSARLAWHMTWAYQGNSDHKDFSNYDRNQMTMYNAITNAVQTKILAETRIEIIIPAGTAIQNARTSYLGDTLTRDGYHLNNYIGRYIGTLSYVSALTGLSIDNITYMPENVDATQLALAIEAVNNAMANPYSITNSTYTKAPTPVEPEEPTPEEPTPEAPEAPEVPQGYRQLTASELKLLIGAFYNTESATTPYSYDTTNAWNLGFVSTKQLTKADLPIGTIIEIADGWQYRPEGWIYTGTRPGNVSTSRVVIDEAWWGTYTYRAFNISQTSHTLNSHVAIPYSEEVIANAIFRVYVPLNPPEQGEEEEEQFVGYKEADITFSKYSYYNSDGSKSEPKLETNTGTGIKYFATQVFTKETLPVGSIIYVHSEWNYRPEAWVRGSGVGRPGIENDRYVLVTEEWWGSYTQRAFNISRDDSKAVTGYNPEDMDKYFKIFIPDKTVEMEQMSAQDMELTKGAFWWSTEEGKHKQLITNHASSPNYFATAIFTEEDLPVGSVIIVDAAWMYRIEGWNGDAKNETRPPEYQFLIMVVTEEWWEDFDQRAFNIALDTKSSISEYSTEYVYENVIQIYVPVTE